MKRHVKPAPGRWTNGENQIKGWLGWAGSSLTGFGRKSGKADIQNQGLGGEADSSIGRRLQF